MKPPVFDYIAADSIAMAVAALAQAGDDAKIIAGGQSLVPMLNFRMLRPSVLVDINRIAGLDAIAETNEAIHVGALTRHYQLETSPLIARHLPVLSGAMTHVAHLAIRNRGTIGGSLAHADPAAELPMMALLLDAELRIASAAGERTVAARDFFLGALTVDLAPGEIVTEVVLPKLPPRTGWGFEEVARRHGDFALAAVAATLTVSGGAIEHARIALTGVGPTALRAHCSRRPADRTRARPGADPPRDRRSPRRDRARDRSACFVRLPASSRRCAHRTRTGRRLAPRS